MISFRSKVTQRVLAHLFLHEDECWYLNQLARLLILDRGNLVKTLRALEAERLVAGEFRGHQHYYGLNRRHPLYREYKAIVLKTMGCEPRAKTLLAKVPGVRKAYLFGSYARGTWDAASDLDLLVIGDHDTVQLQRHVSMLQREFHRECNVVSMSPQEFRRKRRADPWLRAVLKQPLVQLL